MPTSTLSGEAERPKVADAVIEAILSVPIFEGGALSSDFGALLLRGIDRQIGLTARLAAAIRAKRHPSYIDHSWRDLLAQRISQIASGYADANDSNHLRRDPVCTLGVERCPLDAEDD